MGSVCPTQEEDDGEPHKLLLFSRMRCPGPGACADPMAFRSLLIPSDKPDDLQVAMAKPRFDPGWKACKCELELKAKIAMEKERCAQKIAVIADTTTMKDCSGDLHPAARCAFRLRPHLLKLMVMPFDKHTEQMPHGIVELVDLISRFICGQSCYNLTEKLHLAEFAALDMKKLTTRWTWTSSYEKSLSEKKSKAALSTISIRKMKRQPKQILCIQSFLAVPAKTIALRWKRQRGT